MYTTSAATPAFATGVAALAVSALAVAGTPDPHRPGGAALCEIGWCMGTATADRHVPHHPPPPLIAISYPSLMGDAISPTVVKRHVARTLGALHACNQLALAARPHIQGQVTVDFLIRFDGRVAAARATGFAADVASCSAAAIRAIQFPRPDGDNVEVRATIGFRRR
jgi:hypothetical protein